MLYLRKFEEDHMLLVSYIFQISLSNEAVLLVYNKTTSLLYSVSVVPIVNWYTQFVSWFKRPLAAAFLTLLYRQLLVAV